MHISVTKFQDEIAEISFKYVVKRHVFDKISTEFRGILRAFVNFTASRPCEIRQALSWVICMIQTGD